MLLILIGTICLIGFATDNTAREVKQQQQISLIMQDSVSNEQAEALLQKIKKQPYVHEAKVISKEEALKEWNESTGDDVLAIAGYNFFTPEIELSLEALYTAPDSVSKVRERLNELPGVDEVVVPDPQIVSSMDSFFSRTLLILGAIALTMIGISFVLINNTVLLTIYSRRFTIHTMQLVGATPGFIRRPFILTTSFAGVVAGILASGLLFATVAFIENTQMPELAKYLSTFEVCVTGIGLIMTGGALCALSALIATNRYLHKSYDELFT